LPEMVEQVYDLFDKKEIARNTNKLQVKLSPASTVLYYLGKTISN